MNKVAMVAEMRLMHGLNNKDFYSSRLTWLQLMPDLPKAETNNEFNMQVRGP